MYIKNQQIKYCENKKICKLLNYFADRHKCHKFAFLRSQLFQENDRGRVIYKYLSPLTIHIVFFPVSSHIHLKVFLLWLRMEYVESQSLYKFTKYLVDTIFEMFFFLFSLNLSNFILITLNY